MATVTQRIWTSGPRKVKRSAWGYTAQIGGRQARCFREDWTKEDAELAMAARLLGHEPPTTAPGAPSMTFGRMMQLFLDEKRSEAKRSLKDDEERSVPLLAFFGKDVPLAEITTRRVAEYRIARQNTKSKRGRLLAPATVNRECALLRSVLRTALAWDELVKLPVFKMVKELPRERFLSEEEIARLLPACAKSRNRLLHAMVTVAMHTGLRKGELLGLAWEQVDFSRGMIVLGKHTKSGKGREVPMNQAVYAALAPLRSDAGGLDAAGRVWRTPTGDGPRKIDAAYHHALIVAKILDPDVNFHTLRHTFGSWYVSRGGSIAKLQAILGHASVRTTQEHYGRLAPDAVRGTTSILDGLGATPAESEINAPSTHEASTQGKRNAVTS